MAALLIGVWNHYFPIIFGIFLTSYRTLDDIGSTLHWAHSALLTFILGIVGRGVPQK